MNFNLLFIILYNLFNMNITPILFVNPNCYKGNLILVLNQFLKVKIEVVDVSSLLPDDKSNVLSKAPLGNLPLFKKGDFYLNGTKSILKLLLSQSNDPILKILNPSDEYDSSLIEMWIDFAISNIWVLIETLFIIEKKGISITTEESIKKEAISELKIVLEKLNGALKFKTYLVSSNLTLADLIMASSLKIIYDKILDSEDIKKYNNVTRWFKLTANLNEFKNIYGETLIK